MRKNQNNSKEIISRQEFENLDNVAKHTGEPAVLTFLRSHPKSAYKAKAIAKITGTNQWTIFSIMKRLVKQKLVVHNASYYAIAKRK